LAILEDHYGKDCAEGASIYHNLGGLEHARGRFAEGEPFAHKSVELRRLAHNDDHPDVAADSASRSESQKRSQGGFQSPA
jgi:hypothetical protein